MFQRNPLLAHRQVDPEIVEEAWKYFFEHALHWLTPPNVALSVLAKATPYSVQAVKTGSFHIPLMREDY